MGLRIQSRCLRAATGFSDSTLYGLPPHDHNYQYRGFQGSGQKLKHPHAAQPPRLFRSGRICRWQLGSFLATDQDGCEFDMLKSSALNLVSVREIRCLKRALSQVNSTSTKSARSPLVQVTCFPSASTGILECVLHTKNHSSARQDAA